MIYDKFEFSLVACSQSERLTGGGGRFQTESGKIEESGGSQYLIRAFLRCAASKQAVSRRRRRRDAQPRDGLYFLSRAQLAFWSRLIMRTSAFHACLLTKNCQMAIVKSEGLGCNGE